MVNVRSRAAVFARMLPPGKPRIQEPSRAISAEWSLVGSPRSLHRTKEKSIAKNRLLMSRPRIRPLNYARGMRAVLAGAMLLVAAATAADNVPLAFGTAGGEAWQFSKSIDVRVAKGRCDRVAIISPLSTVSLIPQRGHVRAHVPLQSGDNQIKAECRKQGKARATAQQNWNVRLRNAPTAHIGVFEKANGVTLDAQQSAPAPVRASAISRYEWRARDDNPARLAGLPASGAQIELSEAAPDGEYYVTLKATDDNGRADESTVLLRAKDRTLHRIDAAREHAAWIDRAVVYGVVPALFGPGGLADVTARLNQLATLGVTTLWLSPITESPPGDFGYAVTNYFQVRRSLGKPEELRNLVQAAHARGMRVILDVVPNHLSDQHAYFADTIKHAHYSPYFKFFNRGPDGKAEHYFDWNNLKNLNYANPEVQRLVIESFVHWIRDFDVDGFRVDAAWGPKQRAPDFWPRWRAELKRIKPDLLLIAEASARDSYYGKNGFDAAYDWTGKLGEWAWQEAFDDAPNTARRLRSAIEASLSDSLVFRFLQNNDTGPRFRSRYGLGRTRVASAMLLTLPGIPVLYTGEEVGAAYEPYKDAHQISWSDVDGLQSWYSRLIALRKEHPALRSRDIRMLDVAHGDQVLAYVRRTGNPSDSVLVLLNYGASPAHLATGDLIDMPRDRKLKDLLTGDEISLDAAGITIAGEAVRILKPE
jgi:glycosidase